MRADIEKEIQQTNKIIGPFSVRQIICLGIGSVIVIIINYLLGSNVEVSMIPCGGVAVIAIAFGWVKFDGIPIEKIIMKKIQMYLYKTNIRRYKTKNKYISLINKEYDRRRIIDQKDAKRQSESKKNKLIKKK